MIKKFLMGFILISTINIVGCNDYSNQTYNPPVQQEIFYKTISVKITDIQQTWRTNNLCKWSITVISDEYNLEESFEEGTSAFSSTTYGYDLYQGNLKVGDTIKARMNIWKTGDRIDKRQITSLEK